MLLSICKISSRKKIKLRIYRAKISTLCSHHYGDPLIKDSKTDLCIPAEQLGIISVIVLTPTLTQHLDTLRTKYSVTLGWVCYDWWIVGVHCENHCVYCYDYVLDKREREESVQVPVPTSKLYLWKFGFLAWLFYCDPYRTFCLKKGKYVFNIFLIFIKLGFSV